MSSSTVQFRGIDTVVEAYEKRNCAAWSVWAGRQFLFPCAATDIQEGSNQLREFLEMLKESGSNATYTLKVYEEPGNRINEKTACDGSFNFRFYKPEDEQYGTMSGVGNSAIMQRLAGIEAKLAGGTNEDESAIGKIANYVEENEWAQDLVKQLAGHFLKIPNLMLPAQAPATSLAGVPNDKLVNDALAILKARDQKLGEHLMKLAQMEDATYNYLIGMLEKM